MKQHKNIYNYGPGYKPRKERPTPEQKDATERFIQRLSEKHIADEALRRRLFG